MKNNYFINYRNDRFNTYDPQVIDEKTMEDAENGLNYLNPDDFMFLCEANTLEDAIQSRRQDLAFAEMERMHP